MYTSDNLAHVQLYCTHVPFVIYFQVKNLLSINPDDEIPIKSVTIRKIPRYAIKLSFVQHFSRYICSLIQSNVPYSVLLLMAVDHRSAIETHKGLPLFF
jgi:hypothetical protein